MDGGGEGGAFAEQVAAMRRFNRFYTQKIGVLEEGLLDSPFSLTEMRVLYELAHRDQPTATEIGRDLGLDAGYLSRILRRFETDGLVARMPAPEDRRQSLLALTTEGRRATGVFEARSEKDVGMLLAGVARTDRRRLVEAMRRIEDLLGPAPTTTAPFILRPHRPGDMGWVIARHGALYAEEQGWSTELEALAAELCATFIRNADPAGETCWIAERDGENVGSVFVFRQSPTVAKLRMLLVEPKARGFGIGARLVDEALHFARGAGYRKMTLWTNKGLDVARHIYERAGFVLVDETPHASFGKELIGQTWELKLS
jgi:DNA-binding MarR family transcriptional regulator/GNAT superfamily N-acetyltransferase